jgi:hypothetical protein
LPVFLFSTRVTENKLSENEAPRIYAASNGGTSGVDPLVALRNFLSEFLHSIDVLVITNRNKGTVSYGGNPDSIQRQTTLNLWWTK